MAAYRKPEVPRSAASWLDWEVSALQQHRPSWLPSLRPVRWPPEVKQGPGWFPLAEDHPFKGCEFCWRCIAEAHKLAHCETVPHRRTEHVICWGPAEGSADTEDSQPDPGSSVEVTPPDVRTVEGSSIRVTKLDPSGRPVGPAQDLGPAFVHFEAEERPEDFADTGTFFYEPTRYSAGWCAPLESIPPEEFRDTWPPSWTDDAPEAEPVPPDLPKWAARYCPEPVEAHEADDTDRQPGSDEAS